MASTPHGTADKGLPPAPAKTRLRNYAEIHRTSHKHINPNDGGRWVQHTHKRGSLPHSHGPTGRYVRARRYRRGQW